jgi:hypothetical protein
MVMVACGGGGGAQTAGIDRGGVPSVAVVSKGTLTGFGSVVVNGVRFDTSGAVFGIDGSGGSESDLRIGHVVVVKGTLDDSGTTGTADDVSFDDNVEGPIQSIDLVSNIMVVLGQTVRIDGDTAFDDNITPASLEGLAVDDIVEVSGFVRADGSIAATRIERKPAGGEFEVLGVVNALNSGTMTFQVNALVVDYSAAQLDDFPGGAPANGDLVEAKGTSLGAGGELQATRVEFKADDIPGADGDDVELEGFVTRFVDSSDFDVEGFPVQANAQTNYEGGTANDLAVNVKVEVEGELNSDGVIVADRIEFKAASNIRVEALVESVQAGENTLTVLGITINVTPTTRLEDKTDLDVEPLTLDDIRVGDFVAVRGFVESGELTATLLERDDDRGEASLRAVVEAVNEPEFTLFGVTVATNNGTQFENLNDAPLTAGQFFDQALGRLVDAKGTLNGGLIQAEEVSLED